MAYLSLSTHDINVLEKIKDPESNPAANIRLDTRLPRDPHITDSIEYERLILKERDIVLSMQNVEMELAGVKAKTIAEPINWYRKCLSELESVIQEHPEYSSIRNNRAQALRRLYGDAILVSGVGSASRGLFRNPSVQEALSAAEMILEDLDVAIRLLSPSGPLTPMSSQAAKTLSLAHTQRAAIYLATAKLLSTHTLSIPATRRESAWKKIDFEEAASKDFAMGGRYGNEIAKGLAISANPTAKLCGQMVREAMEKEYGSTLEP